MVKSDNNQLSYKKLEKILIDSKMDSLLSSFELNINEKKSVVLACPVGDIKELEKFAEYLKKTEINKLADAIFVYKKGLELAKIDLNALHIKEKLPLGTSGAFFSATYLGYLLGYEIIVVADINVFIDSKKSFIECIELAKKEEKAVFPVWTTQEDSNPDQALSYNVNGFTFYPRSVFEKAGFHIPYTWRGGEDYEFLARLNKEKLVYINKNARASHPRTGYMIFHKLNEKKKFYPYINGLMKAFLFQSKYSFADTVKFVLWYMFYSFFADVFSEYELLKVLQQTPTFLVGYPHSPDKKMFEIKKVREKGAYPYSSSIRFIMNIIMLCSLLISKRASVYTDEIILKVPRKKIVYGLIKAVLLVPLRFVQSILALIKWQETKKYFIYPIKPENAQDAVVIFSNLIIESGIE